MLKVKAVTLHAPIGARRDCDLMFRTGAMSERSPRSEIIKSEETGNY